MRMITHPTEICASQAISGVIRERARDLMAKDGMKHDQATQSELFTYCRKAQEQVHNFILRELRKDD